MTSHTRAPPPPTDPATRSLARALPRALDHAPGWLVEEHDGRIVDELERDGEPLALAARQVLRPRVLRLQQRQRAQDLVHLQKTRVTRHDVIRMPQNYFVSSITCAYLEGVGLPTRNHESTNAMCANDCESKEIGHAAPRHKRMTLQGQKSRAVIKLPDDVTIQVSRSPLAQ